MSDWVENHKPAAAMSTHLLLAGMMWAAVGSALVILGLWWTLESSPGFGAWIALGAVLIGVVKSKLVLDAAARRVAERIRARGDGRCLGGFLSLRSWGFVALMMVAGRLLRASLAHGIAGPLYIAVGCALLLSSRLTWVAWLDARRAT